MCVDMNNKMRIIILELCDLVSRSAICFDKKRTGAEFYPGKFSQIFYLHTIYSVKDTRKS